MIGLPRVIDMQSIGFTAHKDDTRWAHTMETERLATNKPMVEAMHPGGRWLQEPELVEIPITGTDYVNVAWRGLYCPASSDAA